MESIDVNEIKNIENPKIIDIREKNEFEQGTVEGAINIPMMGLILNPQNFLEKDQKYYIICRSGSRSMQTCQTLTKEGYNLVNLLGGYSRYNK